MKNGVSVRDPALRDFCEYLQTPAGTTMEALTCFWSFRPAAENPHTRLRGWSLSAHILVSMLRIPKGRAPWLTARHLFFNNLLVIKTAAGCTRL
jgi:hypothetical protein